MLKGARNEWPEIPVQAYRRDTVCGIFIGLQHARCHACPIPNRSTAISYTPLTTTDDCPIADPSHALLAAQARRPP
jgi:hypothetical protein